jgi:hypothetical protein
MVVAIAGIAAAPAHAYPETFQANLLGWANASNPSFGNKGDLAPANALIDNIAGAMSYGGDLPFAVMTEETCTAGYSGPASQWTQIGAALSYVSGGTYVYSFVGKYVNHSANCAYTGNGVYARANSASSKYADDTTQLPDPNGLDQARYALCMHPILAIYTWTACGSHISNNPNLTGSQLTAYTNFYLNSSGSPKRIAGDLNTTGWSPPIYWLTLNINRKATAIFKPYFGVFPTTR